MREDINPAGRYSSIKTKRNHDLMMRRRGIPPPLERTSYKDQRLSQQTEKSFIKEERKKSLHKQDVRKKIIRILELFLGILLFVTPVILLLLKSIWKILKPISSITLMLLGIGPGKGWHSDPSGHRHAARKAWNTRRKRYGQKGVKKRGIFNFFLSKIMI